MTTFKNLISELLGSKKFWALAVACLTSIGSAASGAITWHDAWIGCLVSLTGYKIAQGIADSKQTPPSQ